MSRQPICLNPVTGQGCRLARSSYWSYLAAAHVNIFNYSTSVTVSLGHIQCTTIYFIVTIPVSFPDYYFNGFISSFLFPPTPSSRCLSSGRLAFLTFTISTHLSLFLWNSERFVCTCAQTNWHFFFSGTSLGWNKRKFMVSVKSHQWENVYVLFLWNPAQTQKAHFFLCIAIVVISTQLTINQKENTEVIWGTVWTVVGRAALSCLRLRK